MSFRDGFRNINNVVVGRNMQQVNLKQKKNVPKQTSWVTKTFLVRGACKDA